MGVGERILLWVRDLNYLTSLRVPKNEGNEKHVILWLDQRIYTIERDPAIKSQDDNILLLILAVIMATTRAICVNMLMRCIVNMLLMPVVMVAIFVMHMVFVSVIVRMIMRTRHPIMVMDVAWCRCPLGHGGRAFEHFFNQIKFCHVFSLSFLIFVTNQ